MPDNLKITRPLDASRINIHEQYEVNYWCKEFGVSKETLIAAVKAVGTSAAQVRTYLKK
ncbi:hypothetical protein HNO92_002211 [Chromobacterium alkanivorans]|uniref:DUF3606 domain-containing protein n=1 Tax=Chromobacterium alkanivorans TaxID=1071719 RepID=UPI0021673390|nr:DUF3606 domain-containing protein [Chromobacterium alkanivorans]MCS3805052.1 hypothetical protein [Chromobacterium alkanivorans]MCS3819385.1 hypothetical protein [Chromobacterium alkanivorans]MCS3873897.1 hypothetical protein [Chromobacterium alkanivorans]